MKEAGKMFIHLMFQQILMQENYCLKNLEYKYRCMPVSAVLPVTPEYDPFDLDIKLKEKLNEAPE